ncbi:MAG: hypothetical protein U9Q71_04645 [Pseudomonadota bacterium]|nr:hypothetical protein [Pseudomonadota bacterium]
MLKFLRRLLYILFAVECLYLLAGNILINTDFLQRQLSRNPEKVIADWEMALTPLPGIYWLSDLSLRIQTPRSQVWLEAGSTLGQISLWRLAKREFHTRRLRTSDLKIYLRPRPRAGRPLQDQYPYFPPIPNARVGAQDEIVDEAAWYAVEKARWTISLDGLEVHNLVDAWLWNYRFRAAGGATADVNHKTRDKLRIANAGAALQIDALRFNDQPITGPLAVNADFDIHPYLPRENRGLKMLHFVSGEFDVSGRVSSLGFIEFYLGKVPWLKLNGEGDLNARLVLERGRMQNGSTFTVTDARAVARVKQYRIEGAGSIAGGIWRPGPDQPWRSELGVEFVPVRVFHRDQPVPLVEASDLKLKLQGSPPEIGQPFIDPRLSLELDEAKVPDLARLNPLLPEALDLEIEAGAGTVSGNIRVSGSGSSLGLRLTGKVGKARLGEHRFRSGFESDLKLEIIDGESYRIDGSRIRLFDARNERGSAESPSWSASLEVEQGELEPWEGDVRERTKEDGESIKSAVRLASGEFRLRGEVSDIGFLNPMLGKIEGLRVGGGADLQARFLIDEGQPAVGSTLQLDSDKLSVNYLDYIAWGSGNLTGKVVETGSRRLLRFDGGLSDVAISDTEDQQNHVQGAELRLLATGHGESFSAELEDLRVELEIPRAPIPDLRVYNGYLPPNAGVRLTGGRGDLNAKFLFQNEQVSGEVSLAAPRVEVDVKGRPVVGGLSLHIPLKNGSPADMVFDVDAAMLRLDKLQILNGDVAAPPWSGRAYVRRGRVKWKQPLALDAEVRLDMDDSGPLVYLFAPGKTRKNWIGEMLTIRDISGFARIAADDRSLVMNNLSITGDGLDLRAQLRFWNRQTEGMLYARLHKIAAAVELKKNEMDWKLIGAKKKYRAYPPFPIQLPVLNKAETHP